MTGPTPATVALVIERDRGRCAKCGDLVRGERGRDWSVHHRTARGMGGSKEKWINLPGALVLLCGSGTTGCHGTLESYRIAAQEAGFIVRHGITKPVNVPIQHAVHGLVLLDDLGGFTPQEVPWL
ncbi:hypothetical protein OC704_02535 [Sweet potato little leaf phytoplasma]|uniref:HNH endonuclease n=1 Tax=Candidatus Phytoplasma australasiaticum TaxID=2754999 RepID=UPI0030E85805